MNIIAISGRMGTGKDTVAEILNTHGFVTAALADSLKQTAARIFDYGERTLFGPSYLRNAVDERAGHEDYWQKVRQNVKEHERTLISLFEGDVDPQIVMGSLHEEIEGFYTKREDLRARYVLQRLGTDWGRRLWDQVWINQLAIAIDSLRHGHTYSRFRGVLLHAERNPRDAPRGVVVTDVRFPNEALAIHAWGGQVYWVDASRRVVPTDSFAHASEPPFEVMKPYVDQVIDNNGSLTALSDEIHRLMPELAQPG